MRDEDGEWEERQRRIDARRTEAMTEIWCARGLDGAIALLPKSDAAGVVGHHVASCAADARSAKDVLRRCLSTADAPAERVDGFMRGFIGSVKEDVRAEILSPSAGIGDVVEIVRLFRCAPLGEQTWRLLDTHAGAVRNQYWRNVVPGIAPFSEAETTELIDRLLEGDRPRAAFFAVHIDWGKVETSRLKRLLLAVATVDSEPADHFKIKAYDISEALKSLGGRPGVTPDEMVQLEFAFIGALRDSGNGIPKLEKRLAESPSLFVQVLAMVFRRNGGGQDPPAWRIDDPARRSVLGNAAHALLELVSRVPGANSEGPVDTDALLRWVTEARAYAENMAGLRSEMSGLGNGCRGQPLRTTVIGRAVRSATFWRRLPPRTWLRGSRSVCTTVAVSLRRARTKAAAKSEISLPSIVRGRRHGGSSGPSSARSST